MSIDIPCTTLFLDRHGAPLTGDHGGDLTGADLLLAAWPLTDVSGSTRPPDPSGTGR